MGYGYLRTNLVIYLERVPVIYLERVPCDAQIYLIQLFVIICQ